MKFSELEKWKFYTFYEPEWTWTLNDVDFHEVNILGFTYDEYYAPVAIVSGNSWNVHNLFDVPINKIYTK